MLWDDLHSKVEMQVPSKETWWDDLYSKVEMQVPSKETDEMTSTAR